jgi:hypothetical protein
VLANVASGALTGTASFAIWYTYLCKSNRVKITYRLPGWQEAAVRVTAIESGEAGGLTTGAAGLIFVSLGLFNLLLLRAPRNVGTVLAFIGAVCGVSAFAGFIISIVGLFNHRGRGLPFWACSPTCC